MRVALKGSSNGGYEIVFCLANVEGAKVDAGLRLRDPILPILLESKLEHRLLSASIAMYHHSNSMVLPQQ